MIFNRLVLFSDALLVRHCSEVNGASYVVAAKDSRVPYLDVLISAVNSLSLS